MTDVTAVTIPINNPFLEQLGIILTDWSPGYAEMRLDISPELGNRTGRIHGGVICTLMDAACGYCGLYTPPGEPILRSLTLSLTTNFLSSCDGATLVAKGYMARQGRSVFFSRAEVWMDDVELLATAVGTFKYVRS
ncbi:PaaI family thioesterase [Alcaligenaceae bacterium]|nr:PaaI family thioesterase [Alcaligenaceae bacterium]